MTPVAVTIDANRWLGRVRIVEKLFEQVMLLGSCEPLSKPGGWHL
jgi:hypothetical protein